MYLTSILFTQKCLLITVLRNNSKRPANLAYRIDNFFFCTLFTDWLFYSCFINMGFQAFKQSLLIIFFALKLSLNSFLIKADSS